MVTKTSVNAIESDQPSSLRAIRSADCNLAIWHRSVPFETSKLLDGSRENIRIEAPSRRVAADFGRALVFASYPPSSEREKLIEDVADLAELFASIVSGTRLEVRLEIVETDSCRKFHADYVRTRLITTYHGSGTQWLDHAEVQRMSQGAQPRTIRRLSPGDVGIFKGRLATTAPAIHRSPPIAGTGERRLLLVINSLDDE